MGSLKKDDKVTWKTPQGKTAGTVTKKVTCKESVNGHTAKASKDEPQFKVKTDSTGKQAIHKPDSLKKK